MARLLPTPSLTRERCSSCRDVSLGGKDSVRPDSTVTAAPGAPLTGGPFLVKVDRYGSVSGLVEVEVALGLIVIARPNEAGSFGRSF